MSTVSVSPRSQTKGALGATDDGASRAGEDRRLLIRYHRDGDQAARETLVERLLPLARRMARRYRRSDEPLDDLVQVATLGLIKAIDRFDPARETAFSSYAVPTMLGELKRYFRDNGWAVHVPRGMQERVMQVDSAVKDLARRKGRSPSAGEVAAALALTDEPSRSSLTASATTVTAKPTLSRSASRTAATSWSSTGRRSRRRSRRCLRATGSSCTCGSSRT
jgi:RNA polymerase sigma-B factor